MLYVLNFYLQISNSIKYYKQEQQATAAKKAQSPSSFIYISYTFISYYLKGCGFL